MQEHLLDFEVVQSDTKTWRFTAKHHGQPLNLTGYEFFFTVKKLIKDPDSRAVIAKHITCANDAESIAGHAFISLSSTESNIPLGNYMYDIKMQLKINGNIVSRKTVAIGSFRVNATGTARVN